MVVVPRVTQRGSASNEIRMCNFVVSIYRMVVKCIYKIHDIVQNKVREETILDIFKTFIHETSLKSHLLKYYKYGQRIYHM